MSLSVYPDCEKALGHGDLVTDAWGVQKVSVPFSLLHGMFTFNIPPEMWFMYEGGTQVYTSTAISSVGGAARLLTTNVFTDLRLESRVCPRYQPNRGVLFSSAVWCPSKTADGVREWGVKTTENGVFFRLKANGLLYAVRLRDTVETEELIDTSIISNFNVENNYTYDIQYQWRSAGNYKFYIGETLTGSTIFVHEFDLMGTLASTSIVDPALPMYFAARRTTQNVELNIGCGDISSENGNDDQEYFHSSISSAVSVNGTNVPVAVIGVPLTYGGKTNTRTLSLHRVKTHCTKKATFKIWLCRNAADITGETLAAVGNGSIANTDSPDINAGAVRATSVTVANMIFIDGVIVAANTTEVTDNPSDRFIDFTLVRGDYLVITCTATTADADVVINWGEKI